MIIRKATADELKSLWSDNNLLTKNYFIKGIEEGVIEFWAVENDTNNKIIGDLYIFWDSEDKDEANGKDRAYLCAFNIDESYRGKGLGKKLMFEVLQRVKEKGFKEVTIGVDDGDSERLTLIYNSWGFTKLIKQQHYDYHYREKNNEPMYYENPYPLFLKYLD